MPVNGHAEALSMKAKVIANPVSFSDSVGINLHLDYYNTVYFTKYNTVIKPALDELGIIHLRQNLNYYQDAPEGFTQEDWNQRIRDLGNDGYKFIIPISDFNWNYSTNDRIPFVPAKDLLQRAKDIDPTLSFVEAFEGVNEYDIHHPIGKSGEWIRSNVTIMTRESAAVIQEDDIARTKPFVGPSYVFESYVDDGSLDQYIDYSNVHPYFDQKPPEWNLLLNKKIYEMTKPYPNSTPWITEFGWNSSTQPYAVSEIVQAKYLARQLMESYRLGIQRSYIYELVDSCEDRSNPECNLGLLRFDGTKKPAFYTIKHLLQIYNKIQFSTEGEYVKKPSDILTMKIEPSELQLSSFESLIHGFNSFSNEESYVRFVNMDGEHTEMLSAWIPGLAFFSDDDARIRNVDLIVDSPKILEIYYPRVSDEPIQTINVESNYSLAVSDEIMVFTLKNLPQLRDETTNKNSTNILNSDQTITRIGQVLGVSENNLITTGSPAYTIVSLIQNNQTIISMFIWSLISLFGYIVYTVYTIRKGY